MAKLECCINGSVDSVLAALDAAIMGGSLSATREDGSDLYAGNCRCAVRVYERYSMLGQNRVSLNLTLLQDGPCVRLSAITAGGSQAMFFKFNTLGEEAFLDRVRDAVRRLS